MQPPLEGQNPLYRTSIGVWQDTNRQPTQRKYWPTYEMNVMRMILFSVQRKAQGRIVLTVYWAESKARHLEYNVSNHKRLQLGTRVFQPPCSVISNLYPLSWFSGPVPACSPLHILSNFESGLQVSSFGRLYPGFQVQTQLRWPQVPATSSVSSFSSRMAAFQSLPQWASSLSAHS